MRFGVIVVMNKLLVVILLWKVDIMRKLLILCCVLFCGLELYVLVKDLIIGKMILLVWVVLLGVVGLVMRLILISV